MSHPDQIYTRNTLLGALSADDLARLKPHFSRVDIARDDILVHADKPVEQVYFLDQGVASIVAAIGSRRPTEVGIFGRDGVSATCLLLGSDRSPHQTFIQVGSGTALCIDTAPYLEAVRASETLRLTLLRFVQTMLVQGAHSTATNAHHRIEARLARWLLMCHDRVDGDEIAITHEFLGLMIAAERSGVTVSLHILEGAGMIRAKRGRVIILDREMLRELADDSYGAPEAQYRHLIGPLGREMDKG
ncbi:MAG: Crp/Fnr family transcriptional regulator [Oxalobacteraceae bacterium]|nr:MAG: Crp/Fnr family transcriptional regulator [Oxalobacteraceae bacterium]